MAPMDHYATLGVSHDASSDDIRAAYRKLCAEHHPDRGGETERMAAINAAWHVLGDPERRREYDAQRAQPEPEPQTYEPKAAYASGIYGNAAGWRCW